jgi:hypothetical protein
MANFTPPQAMYAQHGRAGSVSTMATTDLATRDPMMADRRASSGFGFDGVWVVEVELLLRMSLSTRRNNQNEC